MGTSSLTWFKPSSEQISAPMLPRSYRSICRYAPCGCLGWEVRTLGVGWGMGVFCFDYHHGGTGQKVEMRAVAFDQATVWHMDLSQLRRYVSRQATVDQCESKDPGQRLASAGFTRMYSAKTCMQAYCYDFSACTCVCMLV